MIKDFNDIKEFIVLAKYLNYQEASERLFISPSTLSKHIVGLEKNLGVALFDRTTRNVRLTQYGKTFLEYAEKLVKTYEECNDALNALKVDSDHHIKVGFLSRLEQCGIIEVLSDFTEAYPGISIDMLNGIQPMELLKGQGCDFVFDTESHVREGDVESLLYKEDSYVAVLPKNHPFAKKKSLEIAQLRDEKFIVHNDSLADPAGIDVRRLCEEAGFTPVIAMTASYTSTIVKLVAQGAGMAIINKMNIPQAILANVATVPIVPEIPFNIYLIYSKNMGSSLAREKFLKYIQEKSKS